MAIAYFCVEMGDLCQIYVVTILSKLADGYWKAYIAIYNHAKLTRTSKSCAENVVEIVCLALSATFHDHIPTINYLPR